MSQTIWHRSSESISGYMSTVNLTEFTEDLKYDREKRVKDNPKVLAYATRRMELSFTEKGEQNLLPTPNNLAMPPFSIPGPLTLHYQSSDD